MVRKVRHELEHDASTLLPRESDKNHADMPVELRPMDYIRADTLANRLRAGTVLAYEPTSTTLICL